MVDWVPFSQRWRAWALPGGSLFRESSFCPLHGGMPECHSLGCLVPWLMTHFPFPENRQKEQLSTKGRPFRGMSEEEVFTEVANLFRGQEDLLSEFGQFLPEAKRSLVSTECPPWPKGHLLSWDPVGRWRASRCGDLLVTSAYGKVPVGAV